MCLPPRGSKPGEDAAPDFEAPARCATPSSAFGRARPATGFSLDLRELVDLRRGTQPVPAVITAPWSDDPALLALIARLRDDGQTVLQLLPGQDAAHLAGVHSDRTIRNIDGQWRLTGKDS